MSSATDSPATKAPATEIPATDALAADVPIAAGNLGPEVTAEDARGWFRRCGYPPD